MRSLPPFFLFAASVAALLVACGASVTNVGSLDPDPSGADGSTSPTGDASSPSDADAQPTGDADAGPHACPAGECGARVCGHDECGQSCGVCAAPPPNGGCFMGACNPSCPGTPCLDVDGHHVCEGERGAIACGGGTLHRQVCTCTGGGATACASCGACL